MGISASGYIVLVYYVSYSTAVLGLPLATVLVLLLVAAALFAAAIPMWARWSDRVGRPRVILWGCAALMLFSTVFFDLLDTRSPLVIGRTLAVMLLIQASYIATQPAFFAELFPTAIRYSGSSLSNTLGTILGGAPAPFVAAPLYATYGTSRPIGAYITACAGVSWLAAYLLIRTRGSYATEARFSDARVRD